MRKMTAAAAAALGSAMAMGAAAPALAGDVWVGVYAHDVTFLGDALGLGAAGKEDGPNIHLGWRSERIDSAPDWLGGPRVHAFVSVNTQDDTSYAAVGLNWHVPISDDERWYLRPGFGLAYQDGYATMPSFSEPGLTPEEVDRRVALRSERIEFGSKILFEPELAIGYQVNEDIAIELSYVHLSNGQILAQGRNEGLDEVGLRFVYTFGN